MIKSKYRSCICKTHVQCFQFEILNDILFINSRLAKIGLRQRDLQYWWGSNWSFFLLLCLLACSLGIIWILLDRYSRRTRKLELKIILVSVTDTYCPLFNYLISLGKLYLGTRRRINSLSYKELVKRKYETERRIAAKYNNSKMLEAKWKLVLNSNLLGTRVCNRKKKLSSVRIVL